MKNEKPRRGGNTAGAIGDLQTRKISSPPPTIQSYRLDNGPLNVSLCESAIDYASRGWKIFRLSNSKTPLKNTHGHLDATTDEALIRSWWDVPNPPNIGLACGDIVVLDFDGAEALKSLWGASLAAAAQANGGMPATAVSATKRGTHRFYRAPAGVVIRTRNEPRKASGDPGVDIKAHGGYVVLSPSVSKGFTYSWINRLQVAEMPAWLVIWIDSLGGLAKANSNPLGPPPAHLQGRIGANINARLRHYQGASQDDLVRVRSALKAIPANSYDDWYRVGMSLHSTCWERSDGRTLAFDAWCEWSSTCPEKFSHTACESKWASFDRASYDGRRVTLASVFHLAKQHGWSSEGDLGMSSALPLDHAQADFLLPIDSLPPAQASPRRREAMFNAADLRMMTFDPVRFVLPRFIPEGLTLLVGRPKIGKSWWVLDLCLACAGNRATLGGLRPEHGDVLYLALEDSKRRLQNRIDKLMSPFKEEWPKRLHLVPAGGWSRADEGGLHDIAEWCKSAERPILIVIDTLERIRKPSNGKTQQYSVDYEAITGLQKIALDHGLAIVVLHHDRKSDAEDAFDTVSGTLGLTGAADTILILKRRQSGVVLFARGRDIEESETAMQFDKELCRWLILGAASEVNRSNERARVIAALKTAGQPLSNKEIMIDAEMRNRNAADILLGKMVKDGEILRVGRGRYDLSPKSGGQNGQKESLDSKPADSIDEIVNISNLSDLSDETLNGPHNHSAGDLCR